MGRSKNDGRGRLGGRGKGTPNRVTTDLKTWIAEILDNGRDRFIDSLNDIDSSEFIKVYTGLLNYIVPKKQAINGEISGNKESNFTIVVGSENDRKIIEGIKDL